MGGRGGGGGRSAFFNFNRSKFENNMDAYIGGGYDMSIFSKSELQYIAEHMVSTSAPLYRVEDASWTAKNLQPGDTFNFNDIMKSFTRSTKGVTSILRDNDDSGIYDNPVVFKTYGVTNHFNVSSYGTGTFDYQEESFVKGKGWKVKKIGTHLIGGRKIKVITIFRR